MPFDPDFVLRDIVCPFCGRVNNAHNDTRRPILPRPGDVGLCWGCRSVYLFTTTGARVPTPEETEALYSHPEVARALRVLAKSARPLDAVRRARQGDDGV